MWFQKGITYQSVQFIMVQIVGFPFFAELWKVKSRDTDDSTLINLLVICGEIFCRWMNINELEEEGIWCFIYNQQPRYTMESKCRDLGLVYFK